MVQSIHDYFVVLGTFHCLDSISTSIYRSWMTTLQFWLSNHFSLSSLKLLVGYCHENDLRRSNEAISILNHYFLSKSYASLMTVARQYLKNEVFYISLIDALQYRITLFRSLSREEQEVCIVFFDSVAQLFNHFLDEIPGLVQFFIQRKVLSILCSGLQCFLGFYDTEYSGSDDQAIEEIRMIHIPQYVSPKSILIFIQSILSNRMNDRGY